MIKLHLCLPCSLSSITQSRLQSRLFLFYYVSFAVSLSPTLSSLFVAIQQWTLYTLPCCTAEVLVFCDEMDLMVFFGS